MSGVYKGFKEEPGIYNKRVTFCKIYFPYLAREKWSDHDFENRSEIRSVTRIRKMWFQFQILRQWLEIGALQGSQTASAFCNTHLPKFAQSWFRKLFRNQCCDVVSTFAFSNFYVFHSTLIILHLGCRKGLDSLPTSFLDLLCSTWNMYRLLDSYI